ncbi:hypothetical protein [Calothrix sp. CCY 0018]|uniref:hypothetical protein n=1 Tax=Calothrix sp. CCY 0018 TaxID=3103864 RepID=UPI0039C637FC
MTNKKPDRRRNSPSSQTNSSKSNLRKGKNKRSTKKLWAKETESVNQQLVVTPVNTKNKSDYSKVKNILRTWKSKTKSLFSNNRGKNRPDLLKVDRLLGEYEDLKILSQENKPSQKQLDKLQEINITLENFLKDPGSRKDAVEELQKFITDEVETLQGTSELNTLNEKRSNDEVNKSEERREQKKTLDAQKHAQATELAKKKIAEAAKLQKAAELALAEADVQQFKLSVDNEDVQSVLEDQQRAKSLKEILWDKHLNAISDACKKYKYTIAIRETGALSVKRIAEGAKAKPHTILEKSIKKSSVERYYKNNASEIMDKLKKLNLDGFVGHWDSQSNQLLGVRVDGSKEDLEKQGITVEVDQSDENIQFIFFNIEEDDNPQIDALQKLPNWQASLYTGDYDLHEAYAIQQGMNGQIAEATVEKRNLLNRLNKAIEQVDKTRKGEAKLEGTPPRIHGEGAYAMFQHGDQATYPTNQILEAREAGQQIPARLVRPVASESDEPMAWNVRGEWYVTNNIEEHDKLRKFLRITKPSAWNPDKIQQIVDSQSLVFTFENDPAPDRSLSNRLKTTEWREKSDKLDKELKELTKNYNTQREQLSQDQRKKLDQLLQITTKKVELFTNNKWALKSGLSDTEAQIKQFNEEFQKSIQETQKI